MKPSVKLYNSVDHSNRKTILGLTEYDKAAKFLDVGYSSGEFTKEVAAKIGTNEVYGIELMENLVQSSRDKGIITYQANLNMEFPIENESFDFVCANQVIEHLY